LDIFEFDWDAALSCAVVGSMKFVVERTATFSASWEGCASSQGGVCVGVLEADEVVFDE
jgi:hypothetical protein